MITCFLCLKIRNKDARPKSGRDGLLVPGGDAQHDEADHQQKVHDEERGAFFDPGEVGDFDHGER